MRGTAMTDEEEFHWLLDNFERNDLGGIYPHYCVQANGRTYWFASYPPAERLADILADLHRDYPQFFNEPTVLARDSLESLPRPIVWRDPEVRQEMHARFGYFKPQTYVRIVSNRLPG